LFFIQLYIYNIILYDVLKWTQNKIGLYLFIYKHFIFFYVYIFSHSFKNIVCTNSTHVPTKSMIFELGLLYLKSMLPLILWAIYCMKTSKYKNNRTETMCLMLDTYFYPLRFYYYIKLL